MRNPGTDLIWLYKIYMSTSLLAVPLLTPLDVVRLF